mgnify:CR=1 FL=1
MALKKAKWLKYLFVDRSLAETEQEYWNEKRKKHIANEHKEGVVVGLGVTEANPPSLSIVVQGGRAINTEGNDPEVETAQEIDLTSLVPPSGTTTVYLKFTFNEVEVEPYFVDEIGDYQNKYLQDSSVLEVTTDVPVAPDLELARVELEAGATEITDAVDPLNPGVNEIDLRYRKDSTVFVMGLQDLTDVDPDEADAFNGMNSPSAGNPIATIDDVAGGVSGVEAEVTEARGSQGSLDDRLDVMLDEDGSFKGITGIAPSAPLTGGGAAGAVPIGIDNATPTADGAMSAADKSNLDANTAHSTGDGSDHSDVAANSGHRGTTTGNPHQVSHDDLVGTMPPDAHHPRQHGIDSPADHNGVAGAIENNLVAFDANGLPKDSLVSTLQLSNFDVAILRENYASDAAAGTALKNTIENGSIRSIYVGAGDYEFPDNQPINQVSSQLIVCEVMGAHMRWSASSTDAAYLQWISGTIVIGGYFHVLSGGEAGSAANGALICLQDRVTMIGTYVHGAPGPGFGRYLTGVAKVNLVGCVAVQCGSGTYDDAFDHIDGLSNCLAIDCNNGFGGCNRLSGCEAYSCNNVGFSACFDVVGCRAINNSGNGFVNCYQMSGCYAEQNDWGFSGCYRISACRAYDNTGRGFTSCDDVSGCDAGSNGGYGFYFCDQVSACVSAANDSDGFNDCNRIAACRSNINGRNGFYSCEYIAASYATGNSVQDWASCSKKDPDSTN